MIIHPPEIYPQKLKNDVNLFSELRINLIVRRNNMSLGPWEVVIIFVVILIIFGGKKLPELARGLGQGLREFKKATHDIKEEVENATKDAKNITDSDK